MNSWQDFCGKLELQTRVGQVWSLIHYMAGGFKQANIPVPQNYENMAVRNKDKANMLGKSLQQVHSSESVGAENGKRRTEIINMEQDKLQYSNDNSDAFNARVKDGS